MLMILNTSVKFSQTASLLSAKISDLAEQYPLVLATDFFGGGLCSGAHNIWLRLGKDHGLVSYKVHSHSLYTHGVFNHI